MLTSYELCVLFAGTHTAAEIDEFARAVEALLATAAAEIKFSHGLGRKKLAYPIRGQPHGEYRSWLFVADKSAVPGLNEKLRLAPNVLRYLLLALPEEILEKRIQKVKESKIIKPREGAAAVKPLPVAAPVVPEPIKPKEKEKLSLDELDKKLDEILEGDKL